MQYLSLRGKDKRIKGRDKWFERNDPVDTPVRNTYKQRRNKFSSNRENFAIPKIRILSFRNLKKILSSSFLGKNFLIAFLLLRRIPSSSISSRSRYRVFLNPMLFIHCSTNEDHARDTKESELNPISPFFVPLEIKRVALNLVGRIDAEREKRKTWWNTIERAEKEKKRRRSSSSDDDNLILVPATPLKEEKYEQQFPYLVA